MKEVKFPKGFFTKKRPTISYEKSIKDITPFEWPKEVLNGECKAIISSGKSNNNILPFKLKLK